MATAYGASIYIDPYSADKTCTTYMFRRELVSVTKYSTNYWKLVYRQYTVNTCAKDGYWTNTGTTGRFATQPAETATTRWVLSSLGYWSTTTETMVTDTQPADGAGYKSTLSLASGWDYVETITSCATPVSTSAVRYTLSAAGKWVYSGVVYADAAPASTSAIKYVATTAAVWLVDTGGYDASWMRELVQDAHWAVETTMNTARALATRVNTPPAGWRLPKASVELQTLPSREIVSPFWSRWEGATLTAQPDGTEGTDWRRTLRLQGFTMPVYALVNAGAMMMSVDQGSYVTLTGKTLVTIRSATTRYVYPGENTQGRTTSSHTYKAAQSGFVPKELPLTFQNTHWMTAKLSSDQNYMADRVAYDHLNTTLQFATSGGCWLNGTGAIFGIAGELADGRIALALTKLSADGRAFNVTLDPMVLEGVPSGRVLRMVPISTNRSAILVDLYATEGSSTPCSSSRTCTRETRSC